MKELGYDVEFSLWVGLFAPKGTPEPIITRLRAETKKAVATEQFKKADRTTSAMSSPISTRPSSGVLGRRRQARRGRGAAIGKVDG